MAVLLLLADPGLFLDSRSAAYALRTFGSAWEPRWSRLDLAVSAPSLLDKEIAFGARDLCFRHPAGRVEGCFRLIDARLAVRLWPPRLLRVDRLTVLSDRLATAPSPGPAKPKEPFALPAGLPEPLRGARLSDIRVELDGLQVRSASGTTTGAVRLAFEPGRTRPLVLRADLESGGRSLKARAAVDSDVFRTGRMSRLDSVWRVRLDGVGSASGKARARREDGRIRLAVEAEARGGGRVLKASLDAVRGERRADFTAGAALRLSSGPVRAAELSGCRGQLDLRPRTSEAERVELSCALRVIPGLVGGRPAPVKALGGRVRLDARLPRGDRFAADAALDFEPVRDWYEVTARARLHAEGSLSRLREARLSHELQAGVSVPDFQKMVAWLADTPMAVPAPLHVLRGPVEVKLVGRGDPRGREHRFTLDASSRLEQGRQKVHIGVKGELLAWDPLLPSRRASARADVVLRDVALELPRLDLGPAPRVTVDPRIQVSSTAAVAARPARPRAAFPLELKATVKTEKPAVVHANLAKQPVPIALDLSLQSPATRLSGTIWVHQFDVELFRRTATIDHVRLEPTPGGAFDLDGLILYKAPDATVRILLLGSTAKPRVELQSDPPMERDQIISLLLFNKAPSELDPSQQESVGHTQNALASNAFGLASLYLFASTPIEYVGYDPAARSYSVRFSLPGGASMEVGSDFDETRHLRVRKRLASHWALQTEVRSQEAEGNAVTTFLEWFNRF